MAINQGSKNGMYTHGLTNHPLYKRYRLMKMRCNPFNKYSERYYNRGIRICSEWENSFLSFYNWAIINGFKEELELDRRNNDKGYSPDNCRWVPSYKNMWNSVTTKLTEKEANEIISLKNQGCRPVDIAKFYFVSEGNISYIGRKTWLNVKEKLI